MVTWDRDVLVTAGPGSGKTRVLVGRIERLLSEGVRPEDIVSITFTNKAAAEMKTRLRKLLIGRWTKARDEDRDEEEARRWRSMVWGIEGMSVGTIHSFCSSLLRRYPHLAGLDPEFSALDPYHRRTLIDDIIKTVVAEGLRSDEGGSFLQDLVDRHSYSGRYTKSYVQILRGLYEAGCRYSLSWEEIGERSETTLQALFDAAGGESPCWTTEERDQIVEACETLLQLGCEPAIQRTKVYPPLLVQLAEKWPEWRKELVEGEDPRDTVDHLGNLLQKQHCPKRLKPYVDEVHRVRELPSLRAYLCDEREAVRALVRLMSEISSRYRRTKDEMGALDFDDQQRLVLEMFERHPQLGSELRRAHPHLLLDEFQDTDGVQWDLVRRLRDLAGSGGGGGLFLVGDGDQSIYRFRGADVDVFRQAQKSLVELGAQRLSMTTNFRSSAEIIDIFNLCFSKLFDDYEPLAAPSSRDFSPYCPVEILVVGRGEDDDSDAVKRHAGDATARWVERWIEGGSQLRDVAVLVRQAATLGPVAEALQRRRIPHRIVGGRDFYASQEIVDLRMLLNWLADEKDDIALAGVLRSPFVALDDASLLHLARSEGDNLWDRLLGAEGDESLGQVRDMLREWQRVSRYLPLDQLLDTLFCSSAYREALATWPHGDQALANLNKISSIAASMQKDQRMSLEDFAGHLTTLAEVAAEEGRAPVESEEADVVRVMTIHQAKGLEFPVVILPESGAGRSGSAQPCILNPRMGVAAKISKGTARKGSLYERLSGPEKKSSLEEEMRIFYVACTRAEEKLVLVAPTRAGAAQPCAETFAEGIKELKPSRNSYLGWFSQGMNPDMGSAVEWDFFSAEDEVATTAEDVADSASSLIAQAGPLAEAGLFDPVLPGGEILHRAYSVTALVDYDHCPRLYYLRHLLGWPEVFAKKEGARGGAIDPLLLGTVVHRVCELMPDIQMDEAVRVAMGEHRILEKESEMVRRIYQLVQPYVASEIYAQIRAAHRRRQSYSEWSFSCPLPGALPPQGGVRPQVVGKIDQMFQREDGHWALVDFKTDRIEEEEVEERAASHAFQVNLYRWVVQRLKEDKIGEAYIHFLHPKMTCEVPENSGQPAEERAAEIISRIEGAEGDGDFAPSRNPLCTWCGYRFHCQNLSIWGEDEACAGSEGI